MTEKEIPRLAQSFWQAAGYNEPFPRMLETAVAWALPLAVAKLPRLGLFNVYAWLSEKGIDLDCHYSNRLLRAFLVAYGGRGIAFLDGSDQENERRFSLAHEIAHFIIDYFEPRKKVLELLGDGGGEILDGLRPPKNEERLRGLLRGLQLGVFTHFMDRTSNGILQRIEAIETEDRADLLAIELLAPKTIVLERLNTIGINWRDTSATSIAKETLEYDFGLPSVIAARYGQMLVLGRRSARTFREWLT